MGKTEEMEKIILPTTSIIALILGRYNSFHAEWQQLTEISANRRDIRKTDMKEILKNKRKIMS